MKKEPLTMKSLIDGEYEKCKNSVEYFITKYLTITDKQKLNVSQRQILGNLNEHISQKIDDDEQVLNLTLVDSYLMLLAFCIWKLAFNDSININLEAAKRDTIDRFVLDIKAISCNLPVWLKINYSFDVAKEVLFQVVANNSNITTLGKITESELEVNINNSGTIISRGIKNEEPSKERRVINIPKEQFDIIQKHCDANSLDMAKWMVNNSTSLINQPTTYTMIASTEANTRQSECESETIPVNWLYIVMKEINNDILFMTGTRSSDKFIYWGGVCETKTKYGHYAFYDLDDSQIRVLKLELNKYGYILERDLTTYTKAMRYKISW